MKERFQIYRLPVPTVPPGGSVVALPLKLDSDAPFVCRSISFVGADGGVPGNDDFTLVRWKGPSGAYRQNGWVPASRMVPQSVTAAWRPLYPEITWPENATIEIDIENTSAVPLSGMVVLFRGVKLFPDRLDLPGASKYPQTYSSIPFDLPRYLSIGEVATLNNIALNGPVDAAVAIRGAVLLYADTLAVPPTYANFRASIQDVSHKPYMNDDIEVDWLFGSNPGGSMQLFYPQLWLDPSGIMYYRFVRNDPGLLTMIFSLTWKGSKVFGR